MVVSVWRGQFVSCRAEEDGQAGCTSLISHLYRRWELELESCKIRSYSIEAKYGLHSSPVEAPSDQVNFW